MNNDITIAMLAQQFLDAKAEEEKAIAHRRSISKLIEDAMPGEAEGTTTMKVDGIKLSVARKVTRSVDTAKVQAEWDNLSDPVRNAFKWKAELDTKNFRALEERAEEYRQASQYITSKPAASTVTVELTKQN